MAICSYNSEGTLQNCPNTYPWLETDRSIPVVETCPVKMLQNVNCRIGPSKICLLNSANKASRESYFSGTQP